MAELSELLAQVLAAPAADEPRRAYAAECDRRDDDRGEFIHLQLEAMKYRRRGAKSLAIAPAERARALLTEYAQDWTEDVEDFPGQWRFYRGFVEAASMLSTDFLSHGPTLQRLVPLRHLLVTDSAPAIDALAGSDLLAPLVTLTLNQLGIDDDLLIRLLQSPHLGNLRMLDLGFNRITMRGLEALCAATTVPQLASVNLAGNQTPRHEEGYGVDALSGTIVADSIYLDEPARQLETRFGRRAWFHPVSELAFYPPLEGDF